MCLWIHPSQMFMYISVTIFQFLFLLQWQFSNSGSYNEEQTPIFLWFWPAVKGLKLKYLQTLSCPAIVLTFSGPLMFISNRRDKNVSAVSDQGSLVDQGSLMMEKISEIWFLSLLRLPILSNIWSNLFHNRFLLFIRTNQKMIVVVQSLITLIKLLSLLMCSTTHLDEELCLSRYSRSLLLLSSRRWYLLYFFQLVKLEQILLITVLILKLVS